MKKWKHRWKQLVLAMLCMVMAVTPIMAQAAPAEGSPRGVNSASVHLSIGENGEYAVEGNKTFCLEPSQQYPAEGGYTAVETTDPLLRAMLYYGYGGPGYSSAYGMEGQLGEGQRPYAYVLTHMALAWIYDGCSDETDSFDGLGDEVIAQLKGIVSVAEAYAGLIPSNYHVYTINTGASTQVMAYGQLEPEGTLTLIKSSANPAITNGNSCYSLAGAVYGVYRDAGCTNQAAALTTAADGNSNAATLIEGTYWVKEQVAPKGFALDETVYSVTVTNGQTTVLQVTDQPTNDPVQIVLQKVDKDTGEVSQGTASLAGAQFTIKYYDGYYDKDTLPTQATRTWVIETKTYVTSSGKTLYRTVLDDSHKVSGDEFYRNAAGEAVMPLGTMTIEETKAPDGYLLEGAYLQAAGSEEKITGLYVAQIQQVGDIARLTGGNTFTMSDSAVYGGVKIQKRDYETGEAAPQGDATLEGAEIALINESLNPVWVDGTSYAPGETITVLTTDETGALQTAADMLPKGTYLLKETKAPEGYQLSGVTEVRFSIEEDGVIVDLTDEEHSLKDRVIRGGVKIQKRDFDTGEAAPQGDATLEGAEIALINESLNPVWVDGVSYEPGETITVLTTDEAGTVQTEADTLPEGTYLLKETKAPEGYQLSGVTEVRFSIEEDGVIVDLTDEEHSLKDRVIRGGVKIQKRDFDTGEAAPQGDATLEGAEIALINESLNPVWVDGVSYEPGETITVLTTDETGALQTAADMLPKGTYLLKETKAPEGYQLSGVTEVRFSIEEDGVIVDLTDEEHSLKDRVIRGGVKIQKRDFDTGEAAPQGDATLEGAEIALINESLNPVWVAGASYAPGETITVLTTDRTGLAQINADMLGTGTYLLKEIKAPEGYQLSGVTEVRFSIEEDGTIVDLTDKEHSLFDRVVPVQPKTGDHTPVGVVAVILCAAGAALGLSAWLRKLWKESPKK